MQRFLQRLDGEEAAAAAAAAAASAASAASAPVHISGNNGILGASSCVSGGATLRLVSSNISTSGVAVSGSGTTHLPVYRLMPQESIGSDRVRISHCLTLPHLFDERFLLSLCSNYRLGVAFCPSMPVFRQPKSFSNTLMD
ncbi:hypothetical protein D915_001467 [Fasciola hepatica]|uniref:Uncharacterized protein n=1 Tax=Fasciola hepatica TaxID=6192 RepID=A0A4E0RM05_FASHE|nr:hypothetical protein D915_001467 [Fasciola hepatica]